MPAGNAALVAPLHVANGTCTTRLIEAAGLPGATSLWADPLHDGPVPDGLDDDAVIDVRARVLAGVAGDAAATRIAADLRAWRRAIAERPAGAEVVLWFEHDLFDQLNLIQVLSWLASGPAPARVSLVSIEDYAAAATFKGLGELTPHDMAALFAGRQPVTDAHYAVAVRTWAAFRSPTPDALEAVRHGDTAALPYLAAALARLLEDYPWTRDGLSRTERRLLAVADGGIDLAAALPRMHEGERAWFITDLALDDLSARLATATPPLLTRTTATGTAAPVRVTLTDAGRDVIAGRAHHTGATTDRWVGGVRLPAGVHSWQWDEGRQRLHRVG